jgi:shikimate dehydrogenase
MIEGRPGRLVILGDPVEHSLSPVFQNAALRSAGLSLRYEALRVAEDDLERVARDLAASNSAGNVTFPHKRQFFELCSNTTPIAKRVGAVNTFWTSSGALAGDNTDAEGFDRALRHFLDDEPGTEKVALIGAGGAAAGVLGAIESWPGASVRIFSRRLDQATALAQRFSGFARAEAMQVKTLRGATLVVNATPVGMNGDALPFDIGLLEPGAIVMDLVYSRAGTPLVRAAKAAGHRSLDGTEMLIQQGALSFERWFGFVPDLAAMRAAIA